MRRLQHSLAIVLLLCLPLTMVGPVSAANPAEFNPGRIIDDVTFTNAGTMTDVDIQNFLNNKMREVSIQRGTWSALSSSGGCDTNGSLPHGSGTRAQYGTSQGYPPPYICLKDYSENGKSAARIIWEKAQEFQINPQVLIVLLQKEQGLVTDDWPWPSQYRTATGYGCPDGAPCDAEYFGFTNQVHHAARMFRKIMDNDPNWYTPYRPGMNTIKWHPDAGCGTSQVLIENRSTAALYNYTPYRPNDAALNNLYGFGDGCSSYGNRNFWRDFSDWFGPTRFDSDTNIDWNFEPLDGAANSISGVNTATGETPFAIDFNGVLHTFYYQTAGGDLRHAWADGSGWHFETLDGANTEGGRLHANLGQNPTAMVYNGELHAFYYDSMNGNLRHAWSNSSGSGWQFETLDGAGGTGGRYNVDLGIRPTAVQFSTSLQVFYYDYTNNNLRHAWWNGTQWNFEDLDGSPTSIGRLNSRVGETSFVTTYGDSLQVFYYDNFSGNLRHAWTSLTHGWRFEDLDGARTAISGQESNTGLWATAAVYASGLHLFYYDISGGNLRHAWTTPTAGWRFENLDGDANSISRKSGNVGKTPKTAVLDNMLYVLSYNGGNGSARLAHTDAAGWHFADLDGEFASLSGFNADVGFYMTLTPYSGGLQSFYWDASNGDLRHTWGYLIE